MSTAHNPDICDDSGHPDVAKLAAHTTHVTFKKNDVILTPSEKTTSVHTVVSGLVKVYTLDSQGNENMGALYGPGDVFPMGWIIQERHQNAYFKAVTECEIALLPKDIFLAQLKTSPDLAYMVIQKLLEQIYVYAARANNLGLRYARERLAYRLLVMAARFGVHGSTEIILPYITQQDMASTINVSRENVNREIVRLEKLGTITYSRKSIIIHSPAALRKELGKGVQVMFFDSDDRNTTPEKPSAWNVGDGFGQNSALDTNPQPK
jgi:CRP-like cAMP-binding protein